MAKLSPHLTVSKGYKCCSVCGQIFDANVQPSLSRAFAEHIRTVHKDLPAESLKKELKK